MNIHPIPVTFINQFTRGRLEETRILALPIAGDIVYLGNLGYEVANRRWNIQPDKAVTVEIMLQPLIDQEGKRPFSYPEDE